MPVEERDLTLIAQAYVRTTVDAAAVTAAPKAGLANALPVGLYPRPAAAAGTGGGGSMRRSHGVGVDNAHAGDVRRSYGY